MNNIINSIYILNVAFCIFITLYPAYYFSRFYRMGLVNPFTIDVLVTFPVTMSTLIIGPANLIDSGLFNKYYNFAVLMTSISLVCKFILTYVLLFYLNKSEKLAEIFDKPVKFEVTEKKMLWLGVFFLFLFFICFLLLTADFGFINWVKAPREGYQNHRKSLGPFYGLSITCLSVSYTLVTVSMKKISSILMAFILYVFFAYFIGSKGYILTIAEYTLILLWFLRYKHLTKVISIVVPLAFTVMLINFFSTYTDDIDHVKEAISYFDTYWNSAKYFYYHFKGDIPLKNGEVLFSNYWWLVPRALYPAKPFVYGTIIINEYFWPLAAAAANTPQFGGVVDLYADFGVSGVIILSLLNVGTVVSTVTGFFLYKNAKKDNIMRHSHYLYIFIWTHSPLLLNIIAFPLNLVVFFFITSVIGIGIRLKW